MLLFGKYHVIHLNVVCAILVEVEVCFFQLFVASLRAMFGTSVLSNAVHGASDIDSAKDELRMIFGEVEFDDEGIYLHLVICLQLEALVL